MTVILCVREKHTTLLTHSPGVWDSFLDAKAWMDNSQVWKNEYASCDKAILVDTETEEMEVLDTKQIENIQ